MSALRVDQLNQPAPRRLHMVGNAHLDIAWLWPIWEGFAAVKATFRSALDRMQEYPDFQFSASSAAYYDWIDRNDPAMFDEIKARVAEGRWHLVGGWWVEPDCNIPGGEALVRQALVGQTYFQRRFGRMATVGYNVDSFGHPASLPQLLLKSGLHAYVFMRPQPHERRLPARTFIWESADGSRVTAFRVPFEYCTSAETLPTHIERCAAELKAEASASMCFFGVGNHGGGPTKANIETIARLAEELDVDLVFSSPEQFFDEVRPRSDGLPVVAEELQHHAVGCYAAHSGVKQWNRQAENQLLIAEKLSTIASKTAALPYPPLDAAWKSVLLNQFHDILAGTSISAAYDDARDAYGEARAVANRATHQALQALAWRIGIPFDDGSTPIIVFNPHAWATRSNIELETGALDGAAGLRDENDAMIALQDIQSQASVGKWRRRITFTADLPPMGYRVFRTVRSSPETDGGDAENGVLQNDRWRLVIDPRRGVVSSLFDRRRGCEVLAAGGGRAVVMADESDSWGHGAVRFQQEAGSFTPVRVDRIEDGPVRSVIRLESRFQSSTLIQDFILIDGVDLIRVNVLVDWHERQQVLKLRWPVYVRMPKATFEIAYGVVERPPSGDEEPGLRWFDVSGIHERTGDAYGVCILNDAKYSFDARGSEMSLTVLRSPAFAHHDPFQPHSWDGISFLDQGVQRFSYALLPHSGDWRSANPVRNAEEFNQPPIAMLDTFHAGPLPFTSSFAEATPDDVVVSALKLAEDGSGDVIVRCFEASGKATRGRIELAFLGKVIDADFKPHELKTFRVGSDVVEVNLLECSN